jgi:ribonuclease HII
MAWMAILVGIDEAGFGPLLGPLVVSSCSFAIPRQMLDADLWQVLKKSVSIKRAHLAGRLLITDSKKAYSKSIGIGHLKRTVLACCRCFDKNPATLTELIKIICPESLERLMEYPWHEGMTRYPICAGTADLNIASNVFNDDISANGLKLLELKSCCLDVAFYNKMVSEVKNKSSVLFSTTSQLVKNAYDAFGAEHLQVLVDRQGGRAHYRKPLQLMFPGAELKIIRESETVSSYELEDNCRTMRIHFVVGADRKFLPVSLASMVSKFLRELLVDCMNRYFTSRCIGLQPTAGYWKDGLRFIADLKRNFPDFRYDSNRLIRCR